MIYRHTPTPDDEEVQEVKVVLFRMSECPMLRVEWMREVLGDEKEMLVKVHNVMDALHPLSIRMIGDERVSVVDGVTLTDLRVSVPFHTEKREYPIEEFDGLNVIEDTLTSHPAMMKRESVMLSFDMNGLVTIPSPSGLMLTIIP